MRIAHVEFEGVRGLPDQGFSLVGASGRPATRVVVTGPSGSGKSTLLDAIVTAKEAAAPYGVPAPVRVALAADRARATVRIGFDLDEDEATVAGLSAGVHGLQVRFGGGRGPEAELDPGLRTLLSRYSHAPELPKFEHWEAGRDLPRLASAPGRDPVAEQRSRRLLPGNDKYAGALAMLRAALAGQSGSARLDVARALFAELAPGRSIEALDPAGSLVIRTHRGGRAAPAELSTSERHALLVASVVAFVGLDRSVVLIDGPESGLAPGEASRWLDALQMGRTTQWIVASQDASAIASAEALVRLETK